MLIFIIFSNNINAGNWHASISSSVQNDNRYSSERSVSADTQVNYAYDDNDNGLHGRLSFLLRESDYFFQQGEELYEISIEKEWTEYNTRIKAGRFERSDTLGFYFLDGLNLSFNNAAGDLGIEFYMGKPGRIEDVYSIEGDYLFGFELFRQQKNSWKNEFLPLVLDSWDVRFGLQKIKNISTAHRINLAFNTQGKNQKPEKGSHCRFDCQPFKSQFMLTYHTEQNKIEDLFFDLRIPVNQDLRLRLAYENYRPETILNPGFREQFYSYYAFGEQQISRINADYFFTHRISGFIERLHSNREIGDEGIGYGAGIKIRKLFSQYLDLDLSLSLDSVELGENKLDSIYVNLEHHLNSRLNIQLDGIYREEEKYRFGNNRVFGLNGKINYMAKNNLLFSLEAREVNNTRLRNEYLTRFTMTYYFDNFKARSVEHKPDRQTY